MKTPFLSILLVFTLGFFISCDDDPVNPTGDFAPELANIGENVILRTYFTLYQSAADLMASVIILQGNVGENALNNAR